DPEKAEVLIAARWGSTLRSERQPRPPIGEPGEYVLTDLGTSLQDHDASFAAAINSTGQVVVFGIKTDGNTKVYRTLVEDDKSFKDIGTLGGRSAKGVAINDSGWVVGISYLKEGSKGRAFLYDGKTMKDLGTLEGGKESEAAGINKQGHVVGTSIDASGKG